MIDMCERCHEPLDPATRGDCSAGLCEHCTSEACDLGNLIRRLRRFGERWPHEEATAAMCGEAADELTRLVAEAGRLRDALHWCGGSPSFAPEGEAHEGWMRVVAPLLESTIGRHAT